MPPQTFSRSEGAEAGLDGRPDARGVCCARRRPFRARDIMMRPLPWVETQGYTPAPPSGRRPTALFVVIVIFVEGRWSRSIKMATTGGKSVGWLLAVNHRLPPHRARS